MDRGEMIGMITGLFTGIIMMLLTKSESYMSGISNILFVILLLFAVTMLGYGISKLYTSLFGGDSKPFKG